MKLSLVILLFALHTTASARIGETYNELVTRYGKAVPWGPEGQGLSRNVDAKHFAFQRWAIEVYLIDGHCVYEGYTKVHGGMDQSDIDLILGANSRGKHWKTVETIDWGGATLKVGSSAVINAWVLEGEPLTCIYERFDAPTERIQVYSKTWSEFFADLLRKQREEELKKSGL